jgi:CheY-like chemotaxis protein
MVSGIIKQRGGYVWVESEVGRGATFTIYLPSLPEMAEIRPASPEPVAAPGTETVLLVEDEKPVRNLVRRVLEGKGYTVLEAGSGPEALIAAQQHPAPIHLLLTDVVMPGMSGWELAQLVTTVHPEIKVLCMSGYADDAILDRGALNPRAALIPKPFTVDVLASTLRDVLGKN